MDLGWIKDVITLIPIAALIWKAALQSAELAQLKKDVEANHAKLNNLRDNSLQQLNVTLGKIEVRLTKIETKLEAWSKEV